MTGPAMTALNTTTELGVRPHGTYGKYKTEKCHCSQCRRANRDRNRRWARTKAMAAQGMADPLWVDAEPVRRHVRALMSAGMGVPRIQQVSTVSKGVLARLVYGAPGRGEAPSSKIRPVNAAKLLAVRTLQVADSALVDATGTRRRLQALVTVGWSGAELMRQIGVVGTDFPKLVGRDKVLARTERAIRALYNQLWDTAPPTSTRWERATLSRAQGFAAARGWAPPMAWDDDTINNPAAEPATAGTADQADVEDVDEVAVARVLRGGSAEHLTPAERVEVARRMTAAGTPPTAIAKRLRTSARTVRNLLTVEAP